MAAVTEEGKAYFSPRHVCDALGISWPTQRVKIMEDQVLSTCVSEMNTQLPGSGQRRKYTMLPIEYANGWLFTIKKVRPELQANYHLARLHTTLKLLTLYSQSCIY
ncbi:phage antirepressor N-terminal domain-containing protein [Maridesulfovibrio bastinii]|uniref:phage antirepressor N-terminal domain-containing protein n=1 Tax=Maridesulfovibrio bastinii TaxID=47157 RepID=UPI0009FF9234|nr:phage antirepressor N-terminal domain-containing protein [Maridesulfovibrio bastinii]